MDLIYDSNYGDDKKCVCGHLYVSHFDKEEPHAFIGCAHCCCGKYQEAENKTESD